MTKKRAFNHKHLLGIEHLTREEIELVLDNTAAFKDLFTRSVKKVPTLRGKVVVNLFFENSTRTRTSFEVAAKRLSADLINFSMSTSSVSKGETLLDTARTIEAMASDIIVIRHSSPGAPHILADNVSSSIINAGDGAHEHPTQALLDMYTMREKKGALEGLKVAIVGDILHSRVARSNLWGLTKMGAKVTFVGPPTLIPDEMRGLGAEVCYNLEEGIADADVVMLLRIQLERLSKNLFPSIREYHLLYGITEETLKPAKKDAIVMHPGPLNRGVEVSQEVADGPRSVIDEQVTNGVATRMAVLYLLTGGSLFKAK